MADYTENDVVKKKGKYYLTTEDTADQQSIDLMTFKPYEGKGIIFNLASSYDGWNSIYSTLFNDTINVKKGKYSIRLCGNGTKKVTTGDNQVKINIFGNCKTNIKTGNAENTFYIDENAPAMIGSLSKNTITAGNQKDTYTIYGGTNKITDKGGNNEFTILHNGHNTITTGAGNDTFTIRVDSGGKATIKSGDGVDTLDVTVDDVGKWEVNDLIADLGNGDDIVNISFVGSKVNTLHTNIKTGNGEDNVTISAGLVNRIDTGKDSDTVTIGGGTYNFISTGDSKDTITVGALAIGSTSTIKAGNGDDEIEINNGYNTVYGEAGDDEITLAGGINTTYGGKGTDTITLTGGANTVYADKDKITVDGGANTIKTSNGGNTIDINAGINTHTYLTKGNNTVNINETMTYVDVQNGNNTINVNGESVGYFDNTNKKGTTTINVNGTSRIAGQLGSGVDKIVVNSTDSAGYDVTNMGAGADVVTINNGEHKALYGEQGNDIFYSYGGSNNTFLGGVGNDKFYSYAGSNGFSGNEGNDTFYIEGGTADCAGGDGKDVFNVKAGTNHNLNAENGDDTFNVMGGQNSNLRGGDGKDTFNITGGTSNKIHGEDGNDVFNINDGTLNEVYGGNGNDIFNIKGGIVSAYGDKYPPQRTSSDFGDDIYNLNTKSETDIVSIGDYTGSNIINVAKGYKGSTSVGIYEGADATYKLNFDKSYKLTTSANIKNGAITTNDSNVTIYRNFKKEGGVFDDVIVKFIINTQNELSNDGASTIDIRDRAIDVDYSALTSVKVGGKNYTLDLNALKQDLDTWFSTRDYTDSADVFENEKTAGDIQSLMAVYTKDTAECFVKA